MDTAVELVRWVGLVGALLLTLVILKEVALVLRTLRHIRSLAAEIDRASARAASNLESAERLAGLAAPLRDLEGAGSRVRRAAASVEENVGVRAS